jgi:hypothetical protein
MRPSSLIRHARARVERGALILLSLLTSGCSELTGLVEDLFGDDDSLARSGGGAAWSADGSSIYFTNVMGSQVTTFTVNAVDVTRRRTREVTRLTGWNTGGSQVRTTIDPAVIYVALAAPPHGISYSVNRVSSSGGAAETVATNGERPWFEVSRNGNRLAFQHPLSDTIKVVTLSGGYPRTEISIPPLVANPTVIGLSPDGATLLYDGSGRTYAVPIEGGPHRLLHTLVPGPTERLAPQIAWEGSSLRFLLAHHAEESGASSGTVSFHIVDRFTGVSTLAGSVTGALAVPTNVALSSDGIAYAAWIPMEKTGNNQERIVYRYRLYVKDADDITPRVLWEKEADSPLSWLEFSPDQRRIGFTLEGRLYALDLN